MITYCIKCGKTMVTNYPTKTVLCKACQDGRNG